MSRYGNSLQRLFMLHDMRYNTRCANSLRHITWTSGLSRKHGKETSHRDAAAADSWDEGEGEEEAVSLWETTAAKFNSARLTLG